MPFWFVLFTTLVKGVRPSTPDGGLSNLPRRRSTAAGSGIDSRLFDGYALGKIARLIHIASPPDRNVIREQLQRHDLENRHQQIRRVGYLDDLIGNLCGFRYRLP